MEYKRKADLSTSSIYKLRRCEGIMSKVSNKINPITALEMMRQICEVRNKALQGSMIKKARYCVRNSYFERDARADLSLFMRTLRRKFKGKLPKCYNDCMIYYRKQQKYFKDLKPVRFNIDRVTPRIPSNTSRTQAGIYNGLPWVIHCLETALGFDSKTSASSLYSYFWWFISVLRG